LNYAYIVKLGEFLGILVELLSACIKIFMKIILILIVKLGLYLT